MSAQHLTKDICLTKEMLCGHIADIYLQGYMSALYPSSVFTSRVWQRFSALVCYVYLWLNVSSYYWTLSCHRFSASLRFHKEYYFCAESDRLVVQKYCYIDFLVRLYVLPHLFGPGSHRECNFPMREKVR